MEQQTNRIRMLRKQSGLSQSDLAFLLGFTNPASVCLYELRSRIPSTDTMFALSIIFGKPPEELFPDLYKEVEQLIYKRVYSLWKRSLKKPTTKEVAVKIESLVEMLRKNSRYTSDV
jgi:transcriptional regulator with XRE-family HTH domain